MRSSPTRWPRTRARSDLARAECPIHPGLEGARVEVYKEIGATKLNIYVYEPPNHKSTDRRAAIVFFFGGGWNSGSPAQFEQQCRYLASRGMVAMTADYRVASRHAVKVVDCIKDAKSAVRWIRTNAGRLGIDQNLIAAGGGSAGAHIAAAAATIRDFDDSGEDRSTSSVPNALVLFNPPAALARYGDQTPFDSADMARLADRLGSDPQAISPAHHVRNWRAAGNPVFRHRRSAAWRRSVLLQSDQAAGGPVRTGDL